MKYFCTYKLLRELQDWTKNSTPIHLENDYYLQSHDGYEWFWCYADGEPIKAYSTFLIPDNVEGLAFTIKNRELI